MEIIEKTSGPCVVLAGAGTGKTYTIVEKIKYMIKNKIYSPEKIVCITFSNEAANNLLIRVQKALDIESGMPVIRTFHGFSADLLRKYGNKIGLAEDFKIIEPDQAKVVLHRSLKIQPYYCHKYINAIGTAKDLGIALVSLQSYLDNKIKAFAFLDINKRLEQLQFELQTIHLKDNQAKKKEIMVEMKKISDLLELKKFINAWQAYEKIKEKSNYQDYSDLNKNALILLEKFPEIADEFQYLIIDEFQDTNKLQLDLTVKLARHRNITVVGDMNQSIYRFRGAYKDNFNNFKKAFEVRKDDIFNLDKSYRSPNRVLKAAHKLILNNYDNKEECFFVENTHGIDGQPIEIFELKNAKEEARKVAEIVEDEIKNGREAEEICIMFRTHQQGRAIKIALEMKKIPYLSVTKGSLLKHKAVKTVIDYLTIIEKISKKGKGGEQAWWDLIYQLDFVEHDLIKIGKFIKENKNDNCLSEKILASISGLGLSTSGMLSAKIIAEKINEMLGLSQDDAAEMIKEVYTIAGLLGNIKSEEGKEIFLNLSKFYEFAKNHSSLYYSGLSNFLNYLNVIESLGIEIPCAEADGSGVRLMTLHATKGLEYKTVIITNLAQKRFPMEKIESNSLLPLELSPEFNHFNEFEINALSDAFIEYERKHQLLEERRLCYVAFTRTKEKLILTYANEYAGKKHFHSQFLDEIGYKNNLDVVYKIDSEEKHNEESIVIKPASRFGFALGADNFDEILINIVKNSDRDNGVRIQADRKVFSPSALLTFSECQKEYEYKYIYNMPDRKTISWEAIKLGSFVHQVLEAGVKANFSDAKEFIDLANEMHLKEDWNSVEIKEAVMLIKIFFERNKNKYNKKSRTEQELRAKIGGFNFIGFADRIDFHDEGLEIIDYKTGRQIIKPKHRNWQLGYYALAAASLGKVYKITLDMLKQEKPLEFIIDDQGNASSVNSDRMEFNIYNVEQELIITAKAIVEAYEKGFKPCPVEKNCEFCSEYIYGF